METYIAYSLCLALFINIMLERFIHVTAISKLFIFISVLIPTI